MAVQLATSPRTLTFWLQHEQSPELHREAGLIASGSGVCDTGLVMGKTWRGAVTAAAAEGNTGNGVLTLDATTPALAGAAVGAYTVACVTAASNGGVFRVSAPDGVLLGDVAVGATFANRIKFAIADGAVDFAVGDTFTITVAAGAGKFKPFDPSALDGSEIPHGFLLFKADATAADATGVIITGFAWVKTGGLLWKTGVDAAEQAAAIKALQAKHVRFSNMAF